MYKKIGKEQFVDEFLKNPLRNQSFSLNALYAIFEYLEEKENLYMDLIVLDVVSICSNYTEYKIVEILEKYGVETIEELKEIKIVIDCGCDSVVIYGE